jgi:hypothetical protein
MKKITKKQNKLNAKTILALGVFLTSALFVSQAQTTTVEIDVFPVATPAFVPVGGVHTMRSTEIEHPEGGTFNVSYDIQIADGAFLYQGGNEPLQWGLSSARFFIGANGDATEDVKNIVVTVVDDHNGALTSGNFSNLKFIGASLGDAINNNDAGYFTYNGDEANKFTFGKQASEPIDFPFESDADVTSFNVGVNNAKTSNKWGIASVKISVTYDTTLSTQDFNNFLESGYKLYPNPASNNITVESEAGATITIYSITGASVLEISNATEVQQINTSSLAKGVYLVRVNDVVSKLIIE